MNRVGRSSLADELVRKGAFDCGDEFDLDDPFEDPALVTNAFLDILWQDDHGDSALMLAAAENRILHVKGILTMAINSGKLWQVLDMRNADGLNALQMSVRSGSETCAMLITRVAREYAKYRPRPRNSSETTHEDEITFDINDTLDGPQIDDSVSQALNAVTRRRQSVETINNAVSQAQRSRLNREKIANNLRTANAQHGQEYLRMMKRSRSAHSRLLQQRTSSSDSQTQPSPPRTPPLAAAPPDHGVLSTMGERLRNIFTRKPPVASPLTQPFSSTDKLPAAPSGKERLTSSLSMDRCRSSSASPYHGGPDSRRTEEETLRLPQQSTANDDDDPTAFRSSPWSASTPTPSTATTSSGPPPLHSKPSSTSLGMVSTPNGVRLPPLAGFRRRTASEAVPEFHAIDEDAAFAEQRRSTASYQQASKRLDYR